MSESELSVKFANGLWDKHRLKPEDLKDWWYIGGPLPRDGWAYHLRCITSNPEYHLRYELPMITNRCVCGNRIELNQWITNGDKVITVGSCCIQKFTPIHLGITCEICKKPHRNRKDNKCNECRKLFCKKCNDPYKYPNIKGYCFSCGHFTKQK